MVEATESKSRRGMILAGAIVVVVAGLAVGFRFLQLMPYPKGEFNWVDAPNQRHRAYVCVLTDKGFFGQTRNIYRLKVEFGTTKGKRLQIFQRDILQQDAQAPVDLQHLDAVITWTPDSTRVTYTVTKEPVLVDLPF